MPMSEQPAEGFAALPAWNELSTSWPVSDGLQRDLGRGAVANLADHDHFRVLPQHARSAAARVETGGRVDLRLAPRRESPSRSGLRA